MPIKFFIFGYFGWYNVGDDAIGYSILKELSGLYHDAEFIITVNDPYYLTTIKDVSEHTKIKSVTFNIIQIIKSIMNAKVFIITGGTHFHDEDEFVLRRLKIMLFFFFMTFYARIVNKRPILLGHGIGPISNVWTKIILRFILDNSQTIITRDQDSYDIVKSFGYANRCKLGFDSTVILLKTFKHKNNQENIIGISVLPVYSIYSKGTNDDKMLTIELANCLKSILDKDIEIKIKLFAFRTGIKHSDVQIIIKLRNMLKEYEDRIILIYYSGDIIDILYEIDSCKVFIGMRYHSSLFAYMLSKPLIIIDYMGKCRSLAETIKISKDAIIPANRIGLRLCKCVEKIMKDSDNGKAKLPTDIAYEFAKKMFDYKDFNG